MIRFLICLYAVTCRAATRSVSAARPGRGGAFLLLPLHSALLLALLAGLPTAGAQETLRELLIPIDQLPLVLGPGSDRVLLPRADYEELLRKARKTETETPPLSSLATAAEFHIEFEQRRARIHANLQFEVLQPGVQAVELPFSGIGLRRAELDGGRAALGRSDSGVLTLFLEGVGRHSLSLWALAALNTTPASQALSFHMPVLPATSMTLTVPGDVELRSGAPVRSRHYAPDTDTTRFELLPPPTGTLSLAVSLNSKLKRQNRTVIAGSVIVDELSPETERLRQTVSCHVLHRAVDRFAFRVPPDFEVTSVVCPELARWELTGAGRARTLTIFLREETSGTVLLHVTALRTRPELTDWSLPRLQPLEMLGGGTVAGILLDKRLELIDSATSGLIPIENRMLLRALPPASEASGKTHTSFRPQLAHYAPGEAFAMSASFRRPPPLLQSTSSALLIIRRNGLQLHTAFTVRPENEKRFALDISGIPPDWTITGVRSQGDTPLAYEHYHGDKGGSRIHIRLPDGLPPGQEKTVLIKAEHVPDDWFSPWDSQAVPFPPFSLAGTAAGPRRGAIAVRAEDDLQVFPGDLTGLSPLSEKGQSEYGLGGDITDMAYRQDTPDFSATFKVTKAKPRVTAESLSFFRITPDHIACHLELHYDIRRAGTRRLAFSLPEKTPESVSISALQGSSIKEYSSESVNDRRRWTVDLAARRQGIVQLAVDFEYPVSGGTNASLPVPPLPLPRAENVAFQAGLLAVEGNPELNVELVSHPRPIDIGELAAASYQPGPRLLGAYEFVGPPPDVSVAVSRPSLLALPAVIAQETHLVTNLGSSGLSQTAAEYKLHSKAGSMLVELPKGARLWSATLNGKPANPRGSRRQILIDLKDSATHGDQMLRIVYEMPVDRLRVVTDLQMSAPVLRIPDEGSVGGSRVPVIDTAWHLFTPHGYEVVRSRGPLRSRAALLPPLAAVKLPGLLYELGGEAHFSQGILSALVRNPMLSIPALVLVVCITGTVLYLRRKTQESGLQGFLTGAVQVGLVVLVLGFLAGMLLPALGRAREKAYKIQAMHDQKMRQIEAETAVLEGRQEEDAGSEAGESERVAQPGGTSKPQVSPLPPQAVDKGGRKTAVWAVEGLRSLSIDLAPDGSAVLLRGTGQKPRLQITVWNRDRIDALSWMVGGLVLLIGVAGTGRSLRFKALYILGTLLLSLVLALLPGLALLVPVLNAAFWSALLLAVYYLIAPLLLQLFPFLGGRRAARGSPSVARACLGLSAVCTLTTAQLQAAADENTPSGTPSFPQVRTASEIPTPTVYTETPPSPILPPENAILIPYDPAKEKGLETAEHVLIPRARFQKMWLRAQPKAPQAPRPPVAAAPAGAHYEGQLTDTDTLLLQGSVFVESFSEDPAELLLPLQDAVLTKAALDGSPAQIRVLRAAEIKPSPLHKNSTAAEVQKQARKESAPGPRAVLAVTIPAKGRHRLDLALRIPLIRQGGWRVASAHLPSVPGTAIDLIAGSADSEVRLRHGTDRTSYERTKQGQRIQTVPAKDGRFHVQWRPRVARGQRDHALSVESRTTFEVRADSLHLAWHLELAFQDGEREFFSLRVPEGYRIKNVRGDNVRGWDIRDRGDERRLQVELLKASSESEAFTIYAWQPQAGLAFGEAQDLLVPFVGVPGAVRQIGELAVRSSRGLQLRVVDSADVSRVDADRVPPIQTVEAPLGVRTFQTYEFRRVPFRLQLRATPLKARAEVRVRSLLRVAERERRVETRLELTVTDRPLFVLHTRIPRTLTVESVQAPGIFEWVTVDRDGERRLTIRFSEGVWGEAAVVISGQLGEQGAVEEVALPRINVLNIDEERGQIAVSADPVFELRPAQLKGIETLLTRSLQGWVNKAQHRHLRFGFAYDSPDYSGTLTVTRRSPQVRCWTLTNLRLTDRALEESMLLTFSIHNAGLQQLQFQLPAELADARIQVPLLRRRVIKAAERDGWVNVTLMLERHAMGEVRVLIEHDRALPQGPYRLIPPRVQTGNNTGCYLAVENAGRDEVLIDPDPRLTRITPERREWSAVDKLLSETMTEVYFAPCAEDSRDTPSLELRSKRRQAVSTAGARIGLGQTVLVLDDHGYYRGRQSYRVDNQTEQFLVVKLPEGASLLSAQVAGQLVKPVAPETGQSLARIPLVKTAAGDLDYEVTLKYGGQCRLPARLRTMQFPLLQTVNVKVERSQVELRLPDSRRWSDFRGTMRQLSSRDDLQGYFLEYQTQQAKRLLQTLQFGSKFSQARAYSNVKRLNRSLKKNQHSWQSRSRSAPAQEEDLQRQINESEEILEKTARQLRRTEEELAELGVRDENSIAIRNAYREQGGRFANNRVLDGKPNWRLEEDRQSGQAQGGFNAQWMAGQGMDDYAKAPPSDRQNIDNDANADLNASLYLPGTKNRLGKGVKTPRLREAAELSQLDRHERDEARTTGRAGQRATVARYQQQMKKKADVPDNAAAPQELPGDDLGGSTDFGFDTDTAMTGPDTPALRRRRGLASLDFTLPEPHSGRWTRRFFTTPRGDIVIRARAISRPVVQRLKRVAVTAAALGLLAAIALLIRGASRLRAPAAARVLTVLGAAGLLFGLLPAYALTLLIAGSLWWLTLAVKGWRGAPLST